MRFLAIGEHTAAYSSALAEPFMAAEMDTARALHEERIIREAYMDDRYSDAILLLDAADLVTATTHLNRYPLVKAGLIRFRIIPLVGLPAITTDLMQAAWPAWWPAESH